MAEQRQYTYGTPYKFNGKESDEETGLYYYGARYYDPKLSIFAGIDRFTEKFPDQSPYTYAANNPIKFIDVNGDSTRIYNLGGEYKFTINDNLLNEDHFLSNSNINDLLNQCCENLDQEGEYARSRSEYFVGKNTRDKLSEITRLSNKLQKEQPFVLTIGKTKELDVTNIAHFADVTSTQVSNMAEAIIKSGITGIIGAGHTHPNKSSENPIPFPSPPMFNRMSDYSPHMYNPYNKNIYGGYLSIVTARNGFSIYKNAAIPNSWTLHPQVFSKVPAVLQGFNGKRF